MKRLLLGIVVLGVLSLAVACVTAELEPTAAPPTAPPTSTTAVGEPLAPATAVGEPLAPVTAAPQATAVAAATRTPRPTPTPPAATPVPVATASPAPTAVRPTAAPPTATTAPQAPQAGAVTPVGSVNLSQLTPAPTPEKEEPIVMPAPGVPIIVPPTLEPLLAEMRADAAARSGTAADAVQILLLEAVTWNDGSLGCPQPGQMYTMALVGGHRIILRAGVERYHYHTAGVGRFVYCPNPPDPPLIQDRQ